MHEFRYKNNNLYCGDFRIENLAKEFGTPLYVYSYRTLIEHYFRLKVAFRSLRPLICYSVKSNSNLSILKALISKGAGLDIVSGGELFRAIKVGCPPEKIVYASVGKTHEEIQEAIKRGILFFNVESLPELEKINKIAKRLKKITNIAIRINPDIEPRTHKFITTGKLTNKFGIDLKTAYGIFLKRARYPYLKICGVHIHIGSQITNSAPFVNAISKITRFITRLKNDNIKLGYFNIGGGLGIIYNNERPQSAKIFAKKVIPILKKTRLKIILEPGRFIVGNSGILVTKVLYIKQTPLKKFVIVDAGMNDLIRPALYGAYHQILPLSKPVKGNYKRQKVDIVGPICESSDFLAKDRQMTKVKEGEFLAIMGAGAYGFSMSSNYNSRPKPAEVMVKNNQAFIIRERERFADLIRKERLYK